MDSITQANRSIAAFARQQDARRTAARLRQLEANREIAAQWHEGERVIMTRPNGRIVEGTIVRIEVVTDAFVTGPRFHVLRDGDTDVELDSYPCTFDMLSKIAR